MNFDFYGTIVGHGSQIACVFMFAEVHTFDTTFALVWVLSSIQGYCNSWRFDTAWDNVILKCWEMLHFSKQPGNGICREVVPTN